MENQEDKLRQEILAEARKKAERIVAKAQRDADLALAKADEDNTSYRVTLLDEANQEAVRQVRKIELDVEYELKNGWLSVREAAIDKVLEDVLHEADAVSGEELERSCRALVLQTMKIMGNCGEIIVKMNAAAAALVTPGWLASQAPQATFKVVVDESIKSGLFFMTADGRMTLDNTFKNRMRILKDDFRNLMAKATEKHLNP